MVAPSIWQKAWITAPSAIVTPGPNTTCGSIVQSRPSLVSAENHTLSGSISVAPFVERLLAPAPLPVELEMREFGAAVDPRGLERLALDRHRLAPVAHRHHDHVGQIIFVPGIVVADRCEPAEQRLAVDRHHPRIAQAHRALGLAGVLIFDHLGDAVAALAPG